MRTARVRNAGECLAWLIRDPFRHARASGLFWLLLGGTGLGVILCLSLGIEGGESLRIPGEPELFGGDGQPLSGPNPRSGCLSLAFGGFRVSLFRDGEAMVEFLELMFTRWVAGAVGTALALIWSAGFLPEFLQPRTASLLFSKPISRRFLLLGQHLGVLSFVAFHATLFVGGTWLALGLKTGFWMTGYLWSIPLLLLHFAVVSSVSTLLAVTTRNTVVCVLGSLAVWFLCFAVNYGRHATRDLPEIAAGVAHPSTHLAGAVEVAYWILPKPLDLVLVLDWTIQADHHFQPLFPALSIQPALSLVSSTLFAVVILAIAAREIAWIDY